MTDQEKEVLNIIKTRLGLTEDSQDMLIGSYIKEIGRRILHYCQRRDIPDDLNWVWASMVIDCLRVDQPDQFGGGESDAMSVKIGDTTVGPASKNGVTTTNKSAIDEVVFNYRMDLHRYRRLTWGGR